MHVEKHRGERIGWLRAAVLGANDGLISTSSIVVGVAAAETTRGNILLAAVLPTAILTPGVAGATIGVLLVLGGVAARLGGAPVARGAIRVAFWGIVAMAVTALVGRLFGTVV